MGRHGEPALPQAVAHRAPRARRRGRAGPALVATGVAGGVAVVVALGAFAWSGRSAPGDGAAAPLGGGDRGASEGAAGCADPFVVPVAVGAEDTDLVRALVTGAAAANEDYPCLVAEVLPADDAGAAAVVTRSAGGTADGAFVIAQTAAVVAAPEPVAEQLGWTGRDVAAQEVLPVAALGAGAVLSQEPRVASLAVVNPATPAGSASLLGLAGLATSGVAPDLSQLSVQSVNQIQTQGTMFALYQAVRIEAQSEAELVAQLSEADRDPGLRDVVSVALVDELTLNRYNAQAPQTRLAAVAVPAAGGFGAVQITMTVTDDAGETADAARAVAAFASSEAGRRIVTEAGYRDVEGVSAAAQGAPPVAPAPDALAAALAGWQGAANPGRILLALDVSGSMAEEVPGTGRTKLQFVIEAATSAVGQAPRNSEIGLWEFSTALDGVVDHRELVATGPIEDFADSRTRQQLLLESLAGIVTRADTGLYDTALAAFRTAQAGYRPGEANLVVLLTDGRNDDPGSPDLEAVAAALAAEQDPARPVRIVTIGYGADADTAALTRIAEATGGVSYNAPNPADISRVLLVAFTETRTGFAGGDAAGGLPPGPPSGPGGPGGAPPGGGPPGGAPPGPPPGG